MNHRATTRFWQCHDALPPHVRQAAKNAFELLKVNRRHPSLHFKRVGKFWSARVGLNYRALAVEQDADLVWFWIGSHAEYDHLIG